MTKKKQIKKDTSATAFSDFFKSNKFGAQAQAAIDRRQKAKQIGLRALTEKSQGIKKK